MTNAKKIVLCVALLLAAVAAAMLPKPKFGFNNQPYWISDDSRGIQLSFHAVGDGTDAAWFEARQIPGTMTVATAEIQIDDVIIQMPQTAVGVWRYDALAGWSSAGVKSVHIRGLDANGKIVNEIGLNDR